MSLIRFRFLSFGLTDGLNGMCEVNQSESVAGLTRIQLENWERAVQKRDNEMLAAPVPEHADLPPPRAHIVIGFPTAEGETKKEDVSSSVAPAQPAPAAEKEKEKDKKTPEKRQSLEEAREHAEEAKKKGNAHFGAKRWDAAAACYSEAMAYDPTNAVYPANRALCLLKLGRAAEAEQDCTQALLRDTKYTKAYYRRATARRELCKYVLALDDLNMVLRLEPGNKQAVEEKRVVNELLAAKVRADETDRVTVVLPDEKEEKRKEEEKKVLVEEIASSTTEDADDDEKEEKKEEPETEASTTSPEKEKEEKEEQPKKPAVVIVKPRTFFEFDTQFASLTTDEERAELLRTVPCEKFAAFFKDSLTPSLFARLVTVVLASAASKSDTTEAIAVLDAFATVGRFGILSMTLPSAQKTGLFHHTNTLFAKLFSSPPSPHRTEGLL